MKPDFGDQTWRRGKAGFGTARNAGGEGRHRVEDEEHLPAAEVRPDEVPERLALDLHHDEDVDDLLQRQEGLRGRRAFLTKYERVDAAAGSDASC